MWVLEKEEREGSVVQPGTESLVKIHYLFCGPSLIVSRKAGHVLLLNDSSISRQHASITIMHNMNNLKNPRVLPEVNLKDLGAKFGTFVNDGIEKNNKLSGERVLVNGDRIRFGLLDNIWRLSHRDIVVTTSALQLESKGKLQTALIKLGGHLVSEWMPSCSYLVMDDITLTIKVVCALAAACHIVTPSFFTKWAEAVEKKVAHPDAAQFLPPLQEMSINQGLANFSPNEERKKVFTGKNFLFPSTKQLKRMGPAVELAGGVPVLLCEENYELVSCLEYILVQLPPEKNQEPERTKLFWKSKEILKRNGYRAIPESDVGLAILYRSTEKHCNPSFKVAEILKRNGSSSMSEAIHIYATETQDATQNSMSLTGPRIVPESGLTTSRKTPSTFQTTAPPSNAGLSTATLNSSLSTGASTMMTLDSTFTGKNNSEDKENVKVSSNKRNRTQTTEAEPPFKRPTRSSHNEPKAAQPEPTQAIMIEDEDEEEAIPQDCEVSKFEPKHVSTQKYDKFKTTETSDKKICNTLESGIPSLEPMVGRSIPFEPYTLTSLNVEPPVEDDISTQTFVTVKAEPLSQTRDEPDCYSGKRRREEEMEVNNRNESNWFGKKSRIEDTTTQVKSEKVTSHPTSVKQETVNNDDLFALPTTSERSRRRAEAKKRLPEEGTSGGAAGDLFDLPTSSRAERRRKAMKTEQTSKVINNVNSHVQEDKTPNHPQVPSTSSNAIMSVNERSNCSNTTLNDTWISKKGNESVTKSPVKAEAAVGEVVTKKEPRHGDVAELAGCFEKSLVVVELASLVRRKEVRTTPASKSQNRLCGNLKNFKKFRKNSADITSLPKIIGGKDLVPHDKAEISSREDWFRENPDVTNHLEQRTRENKAELDNLFDMAHDPRSKARGRRNR